MEYISLTCKVVTSEHFSTYCCTVCYKQLKTLQLVFRNIKCTGKKIISSHLKVIVPAVYFKDCRIKWDVVELMWRGGCDQTWVKGYSLYCEWSEGDWHGEAVRGWWECWRGWRRISLNYGIISKPRLMLFPPLVCLCVRQAIFALQCISFLLSPILSLSLWPASTNRDVTHHHMLKQLCRQTTSILQFTKLLCHQGKHNFCGLQSKEKEAWCLLEEDCKEHTVYLETPSYTCVLFHF